MIVGNKLNPTIPKIENPPLSKKYYKIDNSKGSIEIGKDADFTVMNSDFEIFMTIRAGKIIYKK